MELFAIDLTIAEIQLIRQALDVISIAGKDAKVVANLQYKLEGELQQIQSQLQAAERDKQIQLQKAVEAEAKKAAKAAGFEVKIGKFPFSASGKASAAGTKDGFVKLIFDAKYGELLGGHMIGANVTEMVAELVAVRKLETTGEELIKTVHPHPTMSEAIMEAAAAAYGEVIHL